MNNEKKIAIILGAGPAGLACAYELLSSKADIVPIIIDKLPCVGGLSRTVYDDGLGIDIGGHRFHTKEKYIQSIWDNFLKHQNAPSIDDLLARREIKYPKIGLDPNKDNNVMLIRKRFSSIFFDKKFINYPLELSFSFFKKLGFKTSLLATLSYFKAFFVKREEKNLEDFFVNRFGWVLYSIFFRDYTKKVWGKDATELSCDWGRERIRKLSLIKTVLNFFFSKIKFLKFNKETSLIDEFYYPKYGASQLWELMAEYIIQNGGKIILNAEFVDFSQNNKKILKLRFKDKNNQINELFADYFISSIPIKDLIKGVDLPFDIKQNALNLPYRDYILVGFYVDKFNLKNTRNYPTINNCTPECWIYMQDKDNFVSRMQIVNNWSPYLVKDFADKFLISMEYFVNENDDFWNKSDIDISKFALLECEKNNLFKAENVIKSLVLREKCAYPSYFGSYAKIDKIKSKLSEFENLFLIGRNGRHRYCNMDEAMLSGVEVARNILKNR